MKSVRVAAAGGDDGRLRRGRVRKKTKKTVAEETSRDDNKYHLIDCRLYKASGKTRDPFVSRHRDEY